MIQIIILNETKKISPVVEMALLKSAGSLTFSEK